MCICMHNIFIYIYIYSCTPYTPSHSLSLSHRYNVGQVAVGIGDLGLAYQAFKVTISINSNHAESCEYLYIHIQ